MLRRALDEQYAPEVRDNITLLTVSRLVGNTAYRYLVPFVAVIARGLDVNLATMGLALTAGELSGLSGRWLGHLVDRLPRRATLVGGMLGAAAGTAVVATAPNVMVFAVGLVVLALTKISFDIALVTWISERVPLERRGRVLGITEISWAVSLFVGVAVMGGVTALWSWRWAYALSGTGIAVLAVVLVRRLPADHRPVRHRDDAPTARPSRSAYRFVVGIGFMLFATQLLFVTMGPWLEDEHGFEAGQLSAVVFGLGLVELLSSTGAARLTDRWGGKRSVFRGGVLILPAAVLLAAGHQWLVVGLVAFGLMVLGFEYAIVSAGSVASGLVPGSPAAGFGLMITAMTLSRAVGAVLATWLYDHHGPAAPAALAAGAAGVFVVLSVRSA